MVTIQTEIPFPRELPNKYASSNPFIQSVSWEVYFRVSLSKVRNNRVTVTYGPFKNQNMIGTKRNKLQTEWKSNLTN